MSEDEKPPTPLLPPGLGAIGDATGIGSGWVILTMYGLGILVVGAVGAWKLAKISTGDGSG